MASRPLAERDGCPVFLRKIEALAEEGDAEDEVQAASQDVLGLKQGPEE